MPLNILYPQGDNASFTEAGFVAYGTADPNTELTAWLTYSPSNPVKPGGTVSGMVSSPPPNWAFQFSRLYRGEATLSVSQGAGTQPATVKVTIRGGPDPGETLIKYPDPGVQVPSTFTAWGTKDQAESVTGEVCTPVSRGSPVPDCANCGPPTFPGTLLKSQDPTLWAIQFQNITPPGSYCLSIVTDSLPALRIPISVQPVGEE